MGRPWPKKPVPESAKDPDGLHVWMRRFLEWMRVRNYSERTVFNREKSLGLFIEWCEARSVLRPMEVTKPVIERYQRHLYYLRREDGRPLSARGQEWRLVPIRAYFKWLARQNVLLWNPASELELPRQKKRLPKHVLSLGEVEQVMACADVEDLFGLRDRAMLETLYSTGMRRKELIGLKLFDIDAERGTVMIREGKGDKERMVPIGERALVWIDKYLREVRPELVVMPDEGALFLTRFGEAFRPAPLTNLVRQYVDAAELGKSGACHLFRHTMATLMLEHGADIRYIQEMLGHAELSTTQIYTQVSIRRLKEVHTLTHPSARFARSTPPAARDTNRPGVASEAELFARLAAEEGEEQSDDGLRSACAARGEDDSIGTELSVAVRRRRREPMGS